MVESKQSLGRGKGFPLKIWRAVAAVRYDKADRKPSRAQGARSRARTGFWTPPSWWPFCSWAAKD